MANRHVKSCSRLLTTTEMQIKSTKWYHLTPIYLMAIIKKITDNKCWQRCGQKGTQEHCWGECKLVKPLWKTVWKCLKKLKIELLYDSAILLLVIYLKNKNTNSKRHMHSTVHSSIIHDSQDMEATTDEWIKKMWITHAHTYNRVLLSHKKNENLSFATWVDLEDTMLSKISQTEKDKYCIISLLCGIQKLQKTNKAKKNQTHICREQISAYQWGEGKGEEQSRRGWLRCTNYCA